MEHFNPILGSEPNGQKFITCGEIMLRLTPPNYEKIRMASAFEASYGGSEANIALALANLFQRSPQQQSGQERCALAALQRCALHPHDPDRAGRDPF